MESLLTHICVTRPQWVKTLSAISVRLLLDDVIKWKHFRAAGPLSASSDAELWCFFDLCLNKRLSKQLWGWWFGTPSRSLWRHCNDTHQWAVWLTLHIKDMHNQFHPSISIYICILQLYWNTQLKYHYHIYFFTKSTIIVFHVTCKLGAVFVFSGMGKCVIQYLIS